MKLDIILKDDAFKKILQTHRCIEAYKNNFDINFINKCIRMNDELTKPRLLYMDFAFDWDNTDEGFKFWADIDHKWLKFLESETVNANIKKIIDEEIGTNLDKSQYDKIHKCIIRYYDEQD